MTISPSGQLDAQQKRKHSHYFKDVSKLTVIDVYRVLELFNVTDQALGHAIKKLLLAGQRGAGKDFRKDVQEAIDTLQRRIEMLNEDQPIGSIFVDSIIKDAPRFASISAGGAGGPGPTVQLNDPLNSPRSMAVSEGGATIGPKMWTVWHGSKLGPRLERPDILVDIRGNEFEREAIPANHVSWAQVTEYKLHQ